MSGSMMIYRGATTAYSGYSKKKAARRAAAAEAKAAEFSATILEGNADEILRTAEINAGIAEFNVNAIADAYKFNYNLAVQTGNDILDIGKSQAAAIRKKGDRITAQQAALMSGSNNIKLSGTAYDVMMDSLVANEMDALTTIYNSMREADAQMANAVNIQRKGITDVYNAEAQKAEILRKGEFESKNMLDQAALTRQRGQVTASSILQQGNAQFLNSLAKVGNTFYNAYEKGAFDSTPKVESFTAEDESAFNQAFSDNITTGEAAELDSDGFVEEFSVQDNIEFSRGGFE